MVLTGVRQSPIMLSFFRLVPTGHGLLAIFANSVRFTLYERLSMTLREIIDCCVHLDVHEKRCDREDLFELVFFNSDLAEWGRILKAFLGDPVKPSGKAPTVKDLELTETTGSIRIEQTLYEKQFDNGVIIAKFWPWKDGRHVTLRMALLPDSTS